MAIDFSLAIRAPYLRGHIVHTIGKKIRWGWFTGFEGLVLWYSGVSFFTPLGMETEKGLGYEFPLGEGDGWT
jgi:hypothetical protein